SGSLKPHLGTGDACRLAAGAIHHSVGGYGGSRPATGGRGPGDLANQSVTGIRDKHVPRAIYTHAVRRHNGGFCRRTAVATSEAARRKSRSISRESADDSGRIHHATPILLLVCY